MGSLSYGATSGLCYNSVMDQDLQQLLSLPVVQNARISPDQRWAAFTWDHIHENTDAFLVPTDGSRLPVALSHTPEATQVVCWSPDSRAVILAEDHGGDERVRLFRVEIDPSGKQNPGPPVPLTEASPPYFLRGGSLSPDGRYLYYGANYDFANRRVLEPTWIYQHDLHTGERRPLSQPLRPAYTVPELNLTGTHLLYARKDRHSSGRQVHLVDVQGREDREILNCGERAKVTARWLPDGKRILVLAEQLEAESPYIRLGILDLMTGELRWLIDDPRRSIEAARPSPDGAVIVDEIIQAGHCPSWIDPQTGEEFPFPRLPGNLLPLARLTDGSWMGIYYASTSPADLVRFNLDARSPADLASLTGVWQRINFSRNELSPAERFCWTAPDGLPVQGWLYRADSDPQRAILRIHGGPSSHAEDKLNPQIQYFVRRGFHVLDVNYRGSTGFGLSYKESIKQDGWGGREQADIAAGAQALIQAGLASPGRIGITGTSYGGYSAWCQITRYPPELIASAVPVCGMTDLVVDYETTRPDLRPLSEEMMGGNPDQAPERYYERSPIHAVQNIRGRLLIVQGAQDPNVTPENVRQVVQRLDTYDIPYELMTFADEGHGIYRPANQARLYKRMADFFDRL